MLFYHLYDCCGQCSLYPQMPSLEICAEELAGVCQEEWKSRAGLLVCRVSEMRWIVFWLVPNFCVVCWEAQSWMCTWPVKRVPDLKKYSLLYSVLILASFIFFLLYPNLPIKKKQTKLAVLCRGLSSLLHWGGYPLIQWNIRYGGKPGSDRDVQVAMEAQRRGAQPSLGEGCGQGDASWRKILSIVLGT